MDQPLPSKQQNVEMTTGQQPSNTVLDQPPPSYDETFLAIQPPQQDAPDPHQPQNLTTEAPIGYPHQPPHIEQMLQPLPLPSYSPSVPGTQLPQTIHQPYTVDTQVTKNNYYCICDQL